MNRDWQLLRPAPEAVARLAAALRIAPRAAAVLVNRGVEAPDAAERFVNPRLSHLPPPDGLSGMAAAVERVAAAVERGERILIFGDYDVDGVTATALLIEFLRAAGAAVEPYLPDRRRDGYGLQPRHVAAQAAAWDCRLIVTVDCGAAGHDAVAAARRCGIDVVVTDHHRPDAVPLEAAAVVNPQQDGPASLLGDLAGVGVAFYLAIALRTRLRRSGHWGRRPEPNLRRFCDLVALGTVGDMVPLVGANRVLVHAGLQVLAEAGRPGVAALLDVCRVAPRDLDAEAVAFRLVPRLNAAGRIEHAGLALELLLSRDPAEARRLADRLDELNRQRREMENEVVDAAVARIEAAADIPPALVVAGADWHEGVLGIVASRLVRRYRRPAVVLGGRDGRLKGSARSIPGIDVHAAIAAGAAHLAAFGGHPMAAGLQLDAGALDRFRREFETAVARQATPEVLNPPLPIDGRLPLEAVTPALMHDLDRLAPFGSGHPAPLFMAGDLDVRAARIVGGTHLRLDLAPAGDGRAAPVTAMRFHVDPGRPLPRRLERIAFRMRWNRWNGQRTVQLIIAEA